jgi:hypothetical protein
LNSLSSQVQPSWRLCLKLRGQVDVPQRAVDERRRRGLGARDAEHVLREIHPPDLEAGLRHGAGEDPGAGREVDHGPGRNARRREPLQQLSSGGLGDPAEVAVMDARERGAVVRRAGPPLHPDLRGRLAVMHVSTMPRPPAGANACPRPHSS